MFEHQSRALLKFDGDFLLLVGEHNFYFLKIQYIILNKHFVFIIYYYHNYYTRITCTVHISYCNVEGIIRTCISTY